MRTGTRSANRLSFCPAMSPTGSRSGSDSSACPLRGSDDRKDLPFSCSSGSDWGPMSGRPSSAIDTSNQLRWAIHRGEAEHRFSPMDQHKDTPGSNRPAQLGRLLPPVFNLVCCHTWMARFVAFLRAVNVGKRTVAMATARQALADLGFA